MKTGAGDKAEAAGPDRGRSSSNLWALLAGVALCAALWAAFLRYRGVPNGWEVWGFFVIFLILYIPLTYVALRTANLHGALRFFFCLTAAPVYIALFVGSFVWLFATFPVLEESLFRTLGTGARRSGTVHGVLVGLLAAVVFWIWFRVLKAIDRRIFRPAADRNDGPPPAAT